jgi:hypothetical protein
VRLSDADSSHYNTAGVHYWCYVPSLNRQVFWQRRHVTCS